jgi:hypothetical protein
LTGHRPTTAYATVSLLFVYQDGTTVRDQKVLVNKQFMGRNEAVLGKKWSTTLVRLICLQPSRCRRNMLDFMAVMSVGEVKRATLRFRH